MNDERGMDAGAGGDLELGEVLEQGWRAWADAARAPGHPFRTPVVATAGDDGDARVVVLRAVDRALGELEFHTDGRSPKVAALGRSGRVTWVFYDASEGVQWRVRGRARLHAGDDVWREAWARVPQGSRRSYGARWAPGTAVPGPLDAVDFRDNGPDHFVVVRCRAESLDWLRLRPEGNLRARWERDGDGWRGCWVAP